MILTTHALTGAALGKLIPNPILAFIAGFLSHFLFDAIPHWHYYLRSKVKESLYRDEDMVIGRAFIIDLFVIGFDFVLGIAAAILIFQGWDGFSHPSLSILSAAVGAVLPDILLFAAWKIKKEPLLALRRFHKWMHARTNLDERPFFGILSEGVCAAIVIALAFWILSL